MTDTNVEDVLDLLNKIDTHNLKYQVEKMQAIKAWAIKQSCDFGPGDRVEMTDSLDLSSLNGWAVYAETMALGAAATVQRIDFNTHYGYWYADIIFEKEWSASTDFGGATVRRWHGPVADTPEGFEPPSKHDQDQDPGGRKHTFRMPVRHLRKASVDAVSTLEEAGHMGAAALFTRTMRDSRTTREGEQR